MNRFAKRKRNASSMLRVILPLLLFAFILILFIRMTDSMNHRSAQQQYEALDAALRRNVIHTYASEGYFPPSLEYIIERYHLIYNRELFYIDYQPTGRNIMPEITIIRLN